MTLSSYEHSPMEIGNTVGTFVTLTIGMFTTTVTFVSKYFIIKKIESSMVLRLAPRIGYN